MRALQSVRQSCLLQFAAPQALAAGCRTRQLILAQSNTRHVAAAAVAPEQRAMYGSQAGQHQQALDTSSTQWTGQPRSAATTVLTQLLDLMRRKPDGPTHMAVVVDVPGPNFRHLKYPQYKAKRPEAPPQLQDELACVLSVVERCAIPILTVPGVEADDVCGTLAARAAAQGFQVVLVSTDRDFYQLLRPNVSILHNTSSHELFTHTDFAQQFGLPENSAKLWLDVRALEGDASDNIPGVKGIGHKTALQLVQQYGSIEDILRLFSAADKPQQVKLNRRQVEILSSSDGAAAAMFAKQLITIVTDLKHPPVGQSLDNFILRVPDDQGQKAVKAAQALNLNWIAGRLKDMFEEWELLGR